jgi:hypothetical protein
MNKINPVFEESAALRQRRTDLQRVAHKFMIIYLVKDRLHMGNYEAHERFCRESHIEFKIELFNSGIEEDREHVLRLPAYHVYYEEDYIKTYYPETGADEAVHDVIRSLKGEKKTSRGGWHPWFTWTMPKWKRRVAVLGSESSTQ